MDCCDKLSLAGVVGFEAMVENCKDLSMWSRICLHIMCSRILYKTQVRQVCSSQKGEDHLSCALEKH